MAAPLRVSDLEILRLEFFLLCAVFVGVVGCGTPISSRQARDGVSPQQEVSPDDDDWRESDLAALARAAAQLPNERRSVVEVALAMAGAKARQFDCSSFAQHVYSTTKTRLPRTTRKQFAMGQKVPTSKLQAGDLVFFAFSKRPVDHVGIYTGSGSFVHVSSSTRTVRLETLSQAVFASSVVEGRRYLDP